MAQDKGYIAFSLGAALPTGEFGSVSSSDKYAGYALTGGLGDLSLGYKLGKNFGISGLIRGQVNETDEYGIAYALAKKTPVGVTVGVISGDWSVRSFLAGAYGSFPINEKLSFESRLMGGLVSASSASINTVFVGPGGSFTMQQNSVSATAFGFLIGAGLKLNVGSNICLLANIDYFETTPEFTSVVTTNLGSSGTSDIYRFSQPMNTFNFSVVGYRLK